MVHAGFDHGCLMLRRETQQRLRRADLIVKVRVGLERAEMLAQDAGDHLLGRGLADAAGDLHKGDIEFPAVPGGQRLERAHRIGDLHIEFPLLQLRRNPNAQAARRAGGKRLADIVMTVKALARQRDKQRAFARCAAVSAHTCDLCLHATREQRAPDGGEQFFYCNRSHLYTPRLAFKDSLTMVSHSSS